MAKSIIAKARRDRAVEGRLTDAAYTLLSIHRLAIDATEQDQPEFYLTAIADLARSAFKGIDASLERLSGAPAIGNFATEFEVG